MRTSTVSRSRIRSRCLALCNQMLAYLPLPIWLAHQLARRLTMARRARLMPYLTPDGTTQVGIEYRQRRPYRIHSLTVVASQNAPATSTGPTLERLRTMYGRR